MLRDWTGSDKINSLTVHAERFFVRLIMKVDDYGSFYADSRMLKANLFPLLLEAVREADISRWMAECQKAGLIALYESEGKKYLQIIDFRQRLDKAKAKFPQPKNVVNDFPETVTDFPAEVEVEPEVEVDAVNNTFFQFFRRVAGSHITDAELRREIGKFRNKYPNIHPNRCGALVNTWVANIGEKKIEKRMTL